MSNKLGFAVFLTAVALLVGWSAVFVIDETELAIVTQFGKYKRSITEPGLNFKAPLVEQVQTMERRILGSDAPPAEYLTLDKKRIVADPVTRWRIIDPLQFFKTVHDETGARARLDDLVLSEMRREIASHNFGDIVGNARDPMMTKVAERTGATARKEFGIQIIDVRIKRADLPREVQESVYARMRAERERIAKQYRSEGEEEAAKIRGQADQEKDIILGEADKKVQTLRGEGDAQSAAIYAEAYGKDPEFYAFMRSLEAYELAVTADTKVVMSTDTELFQYLGKPTQR